MLADLLILVAGPHELGNNCDLASFLSKLKGIGLKVDEYLFNSLLVTFNDEVLIFDWYMHMARYFVSIFVRESNKFSGDDDVLTLSLVLLDTHNFFNGALYVEAPNVLHELAGLKLGEPKDVFDVEQEEVRGGGHNVNALENFLVHFLQG